MIGPWDETGCIFKMNPASWPPPGNGTVDKYTGYYPMYPLAVKRMLFNFFTSAFGFKTLTGKILTDGVDDYGEILNTQVLWQTGVPFTIEMIIRPQITLGTIEIPVIFKDTVGHAFRLMFMDTATYPTYKGLAIVCGAGNARYGYGTRATFHNIKQHIAITQTGGSLNIIGNWAMYLAGSPVALAPYAGAAGVNNGINRLFANQPVGFNCECELWDLTIYNVKKSAAQIATNAGLGDNYGLKGINVGDLMNFSPAAAIARGVPAGIFEGSH